MNQMLSDDTHAVASPSLLKHPPPTPPQCHVSQAGSLNRENPSCGWKWSVTGYRGQLRLWNGDISSTGFSPAHSCPLKGWLLVYELQVDSHHVILIPLRGPNAYWK